MLTCTKCGRTREDRYVRVVTLKGKYGTRKRARCRARSVCASIARRKNDRNSNRGGS